MQQYPTTAASFPPPGLRRRRAAATRAGHGGGGSTSVPATAARPQRLLLLAVMALTAAFGQGPRLALANVNVTWNDVATMPFATGETSAGLLWGAKKEPLLVVMGWNPNDTNASAATMVLDINASKWSVSVAWLNLADFTLLARMLSYTPADNMQIYEPIKNTWTVGPPPLVQSGAASATVINNTIYHCGGVDKGNTINGLPITTCAKFHIPSGKWSYIAPMPHAVHHAAMANDGKLVYVFGGRNSTAGTGINPVNYTQIYNPANNTWISNTQQGGPAAVPVGRGGMGTAVYYKGHFYLIGGEVRYNPVTNTWDKGLPGMSLARHGAYPVVGPAPNSTAPVVYVCAGGIKQSFSENTLCTYMTVP
ncbi:hypothetical protein PLESTF_000584300 [Pleodorina starrii]|nr:hypothetical protein PLESTF_000584300 [Pleodorina starrii]